SASQTTRAATALVATVELRKFKAVKPLLKIPEVTVSLPARGRPTRSCRRGDSSLRSSLLSFG
ncbi:hypothetical protein, partial [Bacillus licheniformis]